MFYAFRNCYGIGTRDADSGDRIGTVKWFRTKQQRTDYVNSDDKAEAIYGATARRLMLRRLRSEYRYNPQDVDYKEWEDILLLPTSKIREYYARSTDGCY